MSSLMAASIADGQQAELGYGRAILHVRLMDSRDEVISSNGSCQIGGRAARGALGPFCRDGRLLTERATDRINTGPSPTDANHIGCPLPTLSANGLLKLTRTW